MSNKATLVVDLGNSQTRVMTLYGKDKNYDIPNQRLSVLSNKFAELRDSDIALLQNGDYDGDNSKVFMYGAGGNILCSGYICERERSSASFRPSVSMKKYDSPISMYSLNLALYEGYKHIADMTGQDIEDIDVSWDISVLLPPSDLDIGADIIKSKILGISKIKFLMPEVEKNIFVENVKVLPEGFCAFVCKVFENAKKLREGCQDILKSSTLVVDIGAGTSDFCIVKDAKLIDTSRYSEDVGGNQVYQKVNVALRKKFSRNFPEDILREAAITGNLKIGAKVIPIKDILEDAKRDVATEISSSIKNYIEGSSFSAIDIENILICGGESENDNGIKALGAYLKDDLAGWLTFSNFLTPPETISTVFVDGIEQSERKPISVRLMNVLGAGVLSSK